MRFSSYNMEGRIKSKTKFINEGVAECFNSVKYNNHYMLNKHDIDIFESNRQIMMRSDIKLPQPFASWSNSL